MAAIVRLVFLQTNSVRLGNVARCLSSVPTTEPRIPSYAAKLNESVDAKRARLIYQSRKRGILENCLLLSTFAAKYLNTFDEQQLKLYDRLINLPSNDWEIYYWATGAQETPPEFDNEIMTLLKIHAQNPEKETRYQAPPLY